jgi:hypothetical protein
MKKQKKYCEEHNVPMFAPEDGKCWCCNKQIPDTDEKLITGCPFCNYSFCD